jgi:galactokinase
MIKEVAEMEELKQAFARQFGEFEDTKEFFAPGRVNLIGEHTDYNGGHVFPCALNIGTYSIVREREDQKVRFYSVNFPDQGIIEVDLANIVYKKEDDWANYPKGVIAAIMQAGHQVPNGFDVAFYGNIPNGAGLSSSASIELATAVMLNELFQLGLYQVELVKFAQKAENEFVGVNCGIMDQFAIGFGKEDHAILLDCKTLDYAYSPIQLEGISLVIANTNKKRGLADSKYNERRSECERALEALKKEHDIEYLCDLTVAQFEQAEHLIENEVDRKRARHVISENERTIQASEALSNGDIKTFGELMNASHHSLKDDYEVTGLELDALVEAAWEEGAIGSRMTGAGFGGCTVTLMETARLDEFMKNVSAKYEERTGLVPDFYPVAIGDGARQL